MLCSSVLVWWDHRPAFPKETRRDAALMIASGTSPQCAECQKSEPHTHSDLARYYSLRGREMVLRACRSEVENQLRKNVSERLTRDYE